MNSGPDSPLGGLLVMLLVSWWLLRRLGLFHGFMTGFWSGFWTRMFIGTLRSPTGNGLLEGIVKLVVVFVAVLFVLAFLGGHR